ncbi:MAG TPA: HK97-gp10 family putative phage morphogenesis protein [Terriglobales bacterium]|nr:HK97-gp10 family putative phage morphogenesis protein [Terriglobales bacterium]
MSEFVTVEVKGLKELQDKLEELPNKIARRGIRQALRAGAEIIRGEMVSNAPKDSGFLEEHIDVKTRLKSDLLAGSAFIGPNGKQLYPRNPKWPARTAALVAKWLEFGTSRMSKKPFMTQAFETRKEDALEAITRKLREALED